MHIHVDALRSQLHIQHHLRIATLQHQRVIRIPYRKVQRLRRRRAAVDEHPLLPTRRPRVSRTADEPMHRDALLRILHRQHRLERLPPQQRHHPRRQAVRRRRAQHLAPPKRQAERDVRTRQRQHQQHLLHMPLLRRRATQELPPRRQIPEQMLHPDHRPRRTAAVLHLTHNPVVNQHLRPHIRVTTPRLQLQMAHRGDARHRLPPKPQRRNLPHIAVARQLARRMRLKAHLGILAIHPAAVVRHLNQPLTALLDQHPYPRRTRVNRILDQLLHHRSRTLNHLARRNPPRQLRRQYPDDAHAEPTPNT